MNAYRFIRSLASVRRPSLAAIGVLVVASSALAQVPAKMYVDGGISASGDGSNWGQAFKTLDEALANQLSGGAIWVSKGHTYNANLATNYTTGFLITLPFQIYGGLTVSTGTLASRTAADMASTLLEGGFDTGSTYTAYHVINIQELKGDTVVIDGFTIHGGDALNHGGLDGGGIYAPCANLRLANLTLDDNHAQNGGGLFAQGGCPYDVSPPDLVTLYPRTLNITNCKFIHNVVDGVGGGMFGDQVYGQVVNVTFFDNHGPNHGGGVYLWNMGTGNNLEFTSCAFDKNFITTNASGGGGGISVSETTATPPVGGQCDSR